MKLKGFIATAMLVGLMVFGATTKVNAIESETAVQIEQNETEASKWFDKEIMGYIVEFALAFSGAIIAVGSFVKKFKDLTSAFKSDAKIKESLAKQITEDKNEMLSQSNLMAESIKEHNEATQTTILEDNAKTREEVDKLLKVFAIAFANDSKLVKNGAAAEIMKVLGEINENTEA